jgi:hypothetical protein
VLGRKKNYGEGRELKVKADVMGSMGQFLLYILKPIESLEFFKSGSLATGSLLRGEISEVKR